MYHIVWNVLLSIPTVQTKGVALIHYDESKGDHSKFPGLGYMAKSAVFFTAMPLRASSMHVCLYIAPGSLTFYSAFTKIVLLGSGRSDPWVARTRIHSGSDVERQYQLQSFGIPFKRFPVDKNGNIPKDFRVACRRVR